MRIDYILKRDAKYVEASGYSVDVNISMPWVSIVKQDKTEIFMQGGDATAFVENVRYLSKRCECLSVDIIELALCKPYIECLE